MTEATARPRLCSDTVRTYTSLGVGTALSVLFALTATLRGEVVPFVTSCFAVFDLWALAYLAITWRVFAPTSPVSLAERLRQAPARRGSVARALNGGSSGMGFSVQMAATALAAAALLPRVDGLVPPDGRVLATVLVVVAVVASWLLVVVSYTVAYARLDQTEGGLDYPGEGAPTFNDYAYLAVAVSTTFGTTDVTVTTSRARRLVYGHSLLAFVFNTVVLALLVSALVG